MVEGILNFITKSWKMADDIEITLEANPTSVEYEKFKGFKAAGVNRVSIGVQSFDESELKFLGREHSANEAENAIEYAANIFPRYSFDLIYALPKQSLAKWEVALKNALTLTRGHISLYQLTIEQNTNFYHRYNKGEFKIPEDNIAADFYSLTQDLCEAHGLPAYEISNHAAKGHESRHNLTYWNYGEYLGIGAGAHGRINGYATVMAKSPEKWLAKVQEKQNGLEENILLTEEEKIEEEVMMGLRTTHGIRRSLAPMLKNVEQLAQDGFIELTDTNIRVTKKGMLVLNAVTHKLLG